jgi:gliding motility-associated-like protein
MRKCFFFAALLVVKFATADTFVVTSPLDDGSIGTLRWALQSAKDNGNQPNWDTIKFNIPSAAVSARAIQLLSELPVVSSYLIIDGTTQFLGAPFGLSDAKIAITPKIFDNAKRGLVLRNVDHVQIYGLLIGGFINANPFATERWRDAIFMWNVHDIVIGEPGRGNSFTGNFHSIRHEALAEDDKDPLPQGIGHHITIQSNAIGKNYSGRPSAREGVVNGIELINVNNITIGGYGTLEENELMVFVNAIKINTKTNGPTEFSNINIVKNKCIPGTANPPLSILLPLTAIAVNDAINYSNQLVNISGNDIQKYAAGIFLTGLNHPFKVVNNVINMDRANTAFNSSTAISLINCDSGLIGGIDSVNSIHDTKVFAIQQFACKNIKVSRNNIYCNPKGISITAAAAPTPKITDLYIDASGDVYGKTCGRCVVEVFKTKNCTAEYYNGENYNQTILANGNGDWKYTGGTDCYNTSFTVTNINNNTSEFYVPYNFIFDTTALVIQPATCGRNNGSITGVKIFTGVVNFYWENSAGAQVGADTNLLNIAPGLYRLVGTKENGGCQLITGFYEVKNISPVINTTTIKIVDPSPDCNILGAITGILITGAPLNALSFKWTNTLGTIVGSNLNLTNVGQGDYLLEVAVAQDAGCKVFAGPFALTDQIGPKFDLNRLVINKATCGKANGSIKGIKILNGIAPFQYQWKDANGLIVSTSLDVVNLPTGNYQLTYDDASPCPPIQSAVYNVANVGLVSIDETNVKIDSSGCTLIKGAIKNVTTLGANLIEWVNVDSGVILSNGKDLMGIPVGNYQMKAYDNNNGCSAISSIFVVPQTTILPLSFLSATVVDETCSNKNGSIKNVMLSPSSTNYLFKWVKNSIDTFSTSLDIIDLDKNVYSLYGTDVNGCIQLVTQQKIIDYSSPKIKVDDIDLKNDECAQKIGSINNIKVNGGTGPLLYTWYNVLPNKQVIGNNININQLGQGSYYIKVLDKNNCTDSSDIFLIDNISLLIAPPIYDIAFAKTNSFASIKNLNGSLGKYKIYDNINSTTPIEENTTGNFVTQNLQKDKDYLVERMVGTCKSAKIKVHVTVIDESKVFVPNAFTPDGDGLNDKLQIKVYGKILLNNFTIFNRWGLPIFTTNDVQKGWDGYFNGQPLTTNTFTWILKASDIDGKAINLKGTIILIR